MPRAERRARTYSACVSSDVARALEAMAVSDAAGVEAERLHRDHVAAVKRDEAMRRPHELHRGHAVGELVAHHLRDRQARDAPRRARLAAPGREASRASWRRRRASRPCRRRADAACDRSVPASPAASSFLASAGVALPDASSATDDRHQLHLDRARRRRALHARYRSREAPRRRDTTRRAVFRRASRASRARDAGPRRRPRPAASAPSGGSSSVRSSTSSGRGHQAAFFGSIGKPSRSRDS